MVPIVYRGIELTNRYYIDLVVGNIVIVELKAVSALVDIHTRQVLTYLKLTGLPVGLLINFQRRKADRRGQEGDQFGCDAE